MDDRVVVDEVVQAPRAHEERGHHLAGVEALAGVGDDALVVEVDDALAEHLGVDAEVVLLVQEHEDGVGDAADAELQAGAVLHEAGDVAADRLLHRTYPGGRQLDDRLVALDDRVDLVEMDERVAVGARHVGVHLGDHRPGGLGGRLGVVDRDAEGAIAVFVRRRDVDERHVGRQVALAEELGDLAEEHGDVVAAPVPDRLAGARADEQRLVEERVGELWPGVVALAHRDHVVDLHAPQLARPGDQCVDQFEGLAACMGEHHAVARPDPGEGLGGRRPFGRVFGLPVHPLTP